MELLNMTIDEVSYRAEKVPVLFEQYVQQGKLHGQYILVDPYYRDAFETGTEPECWLKGLLASRIFIPPEVYLQVRSPACVRLWFC